MGSLGRPQRTRPAPARLRACIGAAVAAALLAPLAAAPGAVPPADLPIVDLIRVDKSERRMELWAGGRVVRVIRHIQLGRQPVGPKRFEGDGRTPEGRYEIDWSNPESAYHLSLHISYPSAADRDHAAGAGLSPGGMIMIHGQPNGPAGMAGSRIAGDWTDGCIAVSDAEIEWLWQTVGNGTPIEIVP